MKTLILILISFSAFAQQPDVAGDILHPGVPIIPVQPALGKAYLFKYEKGTAILPETVPDGTWILIKFNKPGADTTEVPAPALKETISDHSDSISYTGEWKKAANASWTQKFDSKDVTYTFELGASFSYTFTGKRVAVIAEKCDNHGSVKVDIIKNGVVIQSTTVDTYKDTGGSAASACPAGVVEPIYTSILLPQGEYTVRGTFVANNPAAVPVKDSFVFDGVKVYE